MPIVVVRVTPHQGGREGRLQGEGAQGVRPKLPRGTRDAESQSGVEVTCCCEVTRVTAGERSDTETVTLREARGDGKRGWKQFLASRLLNLAVLATWDIRSIKMC